MGSGEVSTPLHAMFFVNLSVREEQWLNSAQFFIEIFEMLIAMNTKTEFTFPPMNV